MPLPFGSVENARSLIYLGNFVDALIACATSPAAANKTFLVKDGEDVSTPELVRRIAFALGVKPRLLPVPPALMRWAGRLAGKQAALDRLLGSLRVDDSRIRSELGWVPPFSMAQGLEETAAWYRGRHRANKGGLSALRASRCGAAGPPATDPEPAFELLGVNS